MQKRDNVERKIRTDSGSRRPVARGGRLLKWRGKVASVAPSFFICSVGVVGVLAGISSAEIISEEQNIPIVVTMDEDVVITPTGSLKLEEIRAESAIEIKDFSSDFINRGEISAQFATEDDVYGSGIRVSGSVGSPGRFENHGVVNATAKVNNVDEDDEVDFRQEILVWGFLFNKDVEADFTNTGQITAESVTGGYASGDSVVFEGDVTGNVTNAGVATTTVTGRTSAAATGYNFSNELTGDFTNSGTITVEVDSVDGIVKVRQANGMYKDKLVGTAVADAVYVGERMIGNISNSGTIMADATARANASVRGYRLVDGLGCPPYDPQNEEGTDLGTESDCPAEGIKGNFTNSGTITVNAKSEKENAVASGVHLHRDVFGDISNSGAITVTATGVTRVMVEGIHTGDTFNGTFLNTGTVAACATSSEVCTKSSEAGEEIAEVAEVRGVYIDDNIDNAYTRGENVDNITNEGDVVARAHARKEASATAYSLIGDLGDHFSNSGDIFVEAITRGENTNKAEADGVNVESIGQHNATGSMIQRTITNSGKITVTAEGASQATANGVRLAGDAGRLPVIPMTEDNYDPVQITVYNSGEITVMADAVSGAEANGFMLDGTFYGVFSNAREISSTATSTGDEAVANGVHLGDDMTMNVIIPNAGDGITNAGGVKATATAKTKATARAWFLDGALTGDFTNRGSTAAEATSTGDAAEADGVHVSGPMTGDVTSAGMTTAGATAKTKATARAWYLGGGLTGHFNNANTGTIAAEAHSTEAEAVADGVHVSSGTMDGGIISNSGTITATAKGATEATARGLYTQGTVAGIRNTGMISADAEAPNGAAYGIRAEHVQDRIESYGAITVTATGGNAYGIYVENHDGVAEILGPIIATSETGTAYAVYLDRGTGKLNVDTEDRITGLLRIGAHEVTLDARGDSAVYYFEDPVPGDGGTFTTTASDGRTVWFTGDEGGTRPIYAAVNPIHILTSRDIIANTGTIIGGIADRVTADARPGDANVDANAANDAADAAPSAADRFGLNRLSRFASISADSSEFEIVQNFEADLQTYDGNIGVTGVTDGGAAIALGLGVFRAEGDTPATEFESDALYLNAAYGRSFGTLDFAASLGFGWLTNEKSRRIGNSADARAEYDSTLVTADFGVEKAFDVGVGTGWNLDMNGFGTIRYTRQVDEGYTETGSSVNARVGKSVTEVVEARAGVELEKQFSGTTGTLSGGISGVYRTNLTDPSALVHVLSTSKTLTLATEDFSGANLRLGYERELVDGLRLDVSAEQEVGTGAKGPSVRALIDWSF